MADKTEQLADLLRLHVPGEKLSRLMQATGTNNVRDAVTKSTMLAPSGGGRKFRKDELEVAEHARALASLETHKIQKRLKAEIETLHERHEKLFKIVFHLQTEIYRLQRGEPKQKGPVRL